MPFASDRTLRAGASAPLAQPGCEFVDDGGMLERALIAVGERVIRVPAAMTGQAPKVSRQAGKSDPIDARAVALAVVRDGIESFSIAFTDEHAMEIRLRCDHRDQIISEQTG